jgi:hypothetical protein
MLGSQSCLTTIRSGSRAGISTINRHWTGEADAMIGELPNRPSDLSSAHMLRGFILSGLGREAEAEAE